MFATQTTDTYIDNTKYPPIKHETEAAARAYAREKSGYRRCEVAVVSNVSGEVIDTYQDGHALSGG